MQFEDSSSLQSPFIVCRPIFLKNAKVCRSCLQDEGWHRKILAGGGYVLCDDASAFPRRLRQLRTELGWSLADISQAMEVSRGTVSNWEAVNDRQREPSIGVLLALARWFGVSMDYLLGVPGADRDSPQVRQAKMKLRDRFSREVKLLSMPTSAARLQLAANILQEEAPEAYWPERIAAHLLIPMETYRLLLREYVTPDTVIERFAHFAGLPPAWFLMRPTDI